MFTRSRSALVVVYGLLAAAGGIFFFDPTEAVKGALVYFTLVKIWGLFYLLGGLVAFTALALRTKRSNLIALWHFEIAGLALLVAATFVYSFALFEASFEYDSLQIGGIAVVVLSFGGSLSVRVAEAIEMVRTTRKYTKELDDSERGRHDVG